MTLNLCNLWPTHNPSKMREPNSNHFVCLSIPTLIKEAFNLHKQIVDNERKTPINFGVQRSRSHMYWYTCYFAVDYNVKNWLDKACHVQTVYKAIDFSHRLSVGKKFHWEIQDGRQRPRCYGIFWWLGYVLNV